MIDINLYRNRIGNFNLRRKNNRINLGKIFKNQRYGNNQSSLNILTGVKMLSKLILILALVQPGYSALQSQAYPGGAAGQEHHQGYRTISTRVTCID